jgi:hypothetical protein
VRRAIARVPKQIHSNTENKMTKLKIIFDNAGLATLQTESYTHRYFDMRELAIDVQSLIDGDDSTLWDGNESENRISDEEYWANVTNGGYRCIDDSDDLDDYADSSWINIRDFVAAMKEGC